MFLRVLNKVEEAIICLLLVTTTGLVSMDVVMRFGFNSGFIWNQELTLHMSAWFVLFGCSYGVKQGSHIGVDAFVKLFPPLGRRILTTIGCLLALAYCGLIIYGGCIYLNKVREFGIELEDIPVATWIARSILIVGFVFLTIRILILLWSVLRGEIDVFRHADEAKESMELVEELKNGGSKA
ncbi:MAG: TRAP transporter small permease [Desulfobulbus sp.]|nr:TRAP transporter small permease [Desulfobulbus sp.]